MGQKPPRGRSHRLLDQRRHSDEVLDAVPDWQHTFASAGEASIRRHSGQSSGEFYEIEKTVMFSFDLGKNGEKIDAMIETLHGLAKLGIQEAHGIVLDVWKFTRWS